MPGIIATLISESCTVRVTLHELQTVYGVQDAYDLLEVHNVNMHNELKVKKFLADPNNSPGKRK